MSIHTPPTKLLPANTRNDQRIGFASAIFAAATWGAYPLFFKQLAVFGAAEIVAHRILWSFIILLLIFIAMSRLRIALRMACAPGRIIGVFFATVFLSINWYCFIYAINTERVLEASLGYFLLPVVNTIFGVVFFAERLNHLKIAATVIACCGIITAFVVAGVLPIISIILALSFGAYGILRKRSELDSASGLFLETLVLCPFALAFLFIPGTPTTALSAMAAIDAGWLILSGVITLLPLFTMVVAARRIEYNALGFVQYLTPIGHFLIAVLVYEENISMGYAIAFATAWLAILLYLVGLMRPVRT